MADKKKSGNGNDKSNSRIDKGEYLEKLAPLQL